MTTKPFNRLTPGQVERLSICAEEMGEAIQAIGKVLRHGYKRRHPFTPGGPSNRENLEVELGHVEAAIELLVTFDPVRRDEIREAMESKTDDYANGQRLHHPERKRKR